MKIVFEKELLLDALTHAMSAVAQRGDNKATQGVRFKAVGEDGCMISSFDTEKGFQTVIPAQVIKEGCYIINATKLLSIIRNMPMDVTIEVSDKLVAKITSGRSMFELSCIDGKMFPNTPQLSGEYGFSVKQGLLKSMINQTMFAIADNNQKAQLNGAYFIIKEESIKIVALDGFRFAQRYEDCPLENHNTDGSYLDMKFIIMKKALAEIIRFLENDDEIIRITKGLKHIIFERDSMIFYTRQIDGEYMDYNRFIPRDCPIRVRLRKDDLLQSLERALLVTEDREAGKIKSYVKLLFEDRMLKVSCVSQTNRVYDEIAAEKTGNDLEIGFNCKFIVDCFRAVPGEYVRIGLTTPLSSMTVEPDKEGDGSFFYFVFPVRMRDN